MEANNTGTNKLVERILADAKAAAAEVRAEAGASAMKLSAENVAVQNARKKDFETKRDAAVQSVLDGSRTRAAIDGRKAALAKKRAVIEAVFDSAYQSLCALDAEKRGAICAQLLARETEGGETVLPAKADRAELQRTIAAMPQKKLVLSAEDAAIDGGFLLVGHGYEKDCSFRAILNQLRGDEETAVAKILFD